MTWREHIERAESDYYSPSRKVINNLLNVKLKLSEVDFFIRPDKITQYLVPPNVDYMLYRRDNQWVCEIRKSAQSRTVLGFYGSPSEVVARIGAYLDWDSNG